MSSAPFNKIKDLKLLFIFAKSSILDVWLSLSAPMNYRKKFFFHPFFRKLEISEISQEICSWKTFWDKPSGQPVLQLLQKDCPCRCPKYLKCSNCYIYYIYICIYIFIYILYIYIIYIVYVYYMYDTNSCLVSNLWYFRILEA